MKVLITGITSLLGLGLLSTKPKDVHIVGTFFKNTKSNVLNKITCYKLDVTDKKAIEKIFLKIKPSVFIHNASIGNVDYCEKHKREAFKMNVLSTKYFIEICKKNNCRFIFPSTNAIFNGLNPPYNIKSIPSPLNYYGKTKVMSEELIQSSK